MSVFNDRECQFSVIAHTRCSAHPGKPDEDPKTARSMADFSNGRGRRPARVLPSGIPLAIPLTSRPPTGHPRCKCVEESAGVG